MQPDRKSGLFDSTTDLEAASSFRTTKARMARSDKGLQTQCRSCLVMVFSFEIHELFLAFQDSTQRVQELATLMDFGAFDPVVG